MQVPFPQDPAAAPAPSPDLLQSLQHLGWVDLTALAVLLVFFVIGLFKGLIWQVSRIAILVLAYVAAGRFGATVGAWFARTPAVGGEPGRATGDTPDTTLYLAYVLIFLAVLVVLSLASILLQRLAQKAGLGFFDRLGGGVLGVATGACVVLFGLFVVNMFFQGSHLASAAHSSHALRLSRRAIDLLGDGVPDELRTVIALQPLRSLPPHHTPGRADEPLPPAAPDQPPVHVPERPHEPR
ncbi:MAG: CvpA family protein [Planctomycetes bacterium]|nr:CvpA family protein [Planctomycetota bacterium]